MGKMQRRLTSSQIIMLGFAGLILLGCALLMLPFATRDGQGARFSDALFTATSAVCVTGLIVQNTATYWSSFGQAVLLLLIQIGGMGVVTVAVAITKAAGKNITLRQRSTMQDSISAPKVGGIVPFTGFILRTAAAIELLGAAVMAPTFCRQYGAGRGAWYALFHSVSAFCNAGFDLLGEAVPFSSLTAYADHPIINAAIMLLIVLGGVGFLTWEDIKTEKFRLRRYRMQSKVILCVSAALIVLPAMYFFCAEFSQLPFGARLWRSLFQSVTTRTAGFNTVELTDLSENGIGVMILLMLVGGSPGSTAGGMKTTTLAVLLATAVSVIRRKGDTTLVGRRISEETARNAITLLVMYLVLFLVSGFVISGVEGLPLQVCLFETASAVGTVGLTLGITPGLSQLSRVILMALMYIGRVGGLTLIYSAAMWNPENGAKLPLEKITVG